MVCRQQGVPAAPPLLVPPPVCDSEPAGVEGPSYAGGRLTGLRVPLHPWLGCAVPSYTHTSRTVGRCAPHPPKSRSSPWSQAAPQPLHSQGHTCESLFPCKEKHSCHFVTSKTLCRAPAKQDVFPPSGGPAYRTLLREHPSSTLGVLPWLHTRAWLLALSVEQQPQGGHPRASAGFL